ncbi:MAG: nicotinate-nucleotide adenylyltransferase [Alphaproteobacteria bacterium]|nr:nicotinate-nucleotide adenylyltransferase [Alphaproteobacteria bacterium]
MKNSETTDSKEETGERRIGLLGGSFNPAHAGHLHVSRQALRLLELDEIWWLVSPQNPLKPENGMAPLRDRMDVARHMAGDDPKISVTDIEAELGTIYTVDTLEALRQRHSRANFALLAGADILEEIPRWRRWERIFEIVPIAVFARKPYTLKALSGLAAQRFAQFRIKEEDAPTLASRTPPAWVFLHIEEHPASATAIRAARETG